LSARLLRVQRVSLLQRHRGRLDFIRERPCQREAIHYHPAVHHQGWRAIAHQGHLQEGAGVVATRGMCSMCTEYGSPISRKTVRERAMASSHRSPRFRRNAGGSQKAFLCLPDQILIHAETRRIRGRGSQETLSAVRDTIRPSNPRRTSAPGFFYSHSDETVYLRYFRQVRAMPTSRLRPWSPGLSGAHGFCGDAWGLGLERIIGWPICGGKEDRGIVEVPTQSMRIPGTGLGPCSNST